MQLSFPSAFQRVPPQSVGASLFSRRRASAMRPALRSLSLSVFSLISRFERDRLCDEVLEHG